MSRYYAKKWGLFHNRAVRREIDALDADRGTQRIAYLLGAYEFGWDLNRSLEIALFYTFGSVAVSRLLDRTSEFEKHGQKRYDDTALLIGHFIESGWDGEFGRRAIERMNQTHAHYRIHNDDFLFVLWTFIEFPIRWTHCYGRRRMTAHEQRAWFNFWCEIGRRMGLADIPATKTEFATLISRYQDEMLVYAASSARVSNATIHIIENWLPRFLRRGVKPVVSCLMPAIFLDAVGYRHPPSWQRRLVAGALRAVGWANRVIAFGDYPKQTARRRQRTYASGYSIDDLRPYHLTQRIRRKQAPAQPAPPSTEL